MVLYCIECTCLSRDLSRSTLRGLNSSTCYSLVLSLFCSSWPSGCAVFFFSSFSPLCTVPLLLRSLPSPIPSSSSRRDYLTCSSPRECHFKLALLLALVRAHTNTLPMPRLAQIDFVPQTISLLVSSARSLLTTSFFRVPLSLSFLISSSLHIPPLVIF